MTKEELKQEANLEASIMPWDEETDTWEDIAERAYIKGAEPREKRIAELEAQIEKMKCCGNCGNERCTSKYRGNSAYHRQADGFACADNEDWKLREIKEK